MSAVRRRFGCGAKAIRRESIRKPFVQYRHRGASSDRFMPQRTEIPAGRFDPTPGGNAATTAEAGNGGLQATSGRSHTEMPGGAEMPSDTLVIIGLSLISGRLDLRDLNNKKICASLHALKDDRPHESHVPELKRQNRKENAL